MTIACTLPARHKAANIAHPHKFVLDNRHMESWARGRAEGVAAGYKQGWDAAQEFWLTDHESGRHEGYREGRQEGYETGLEEGREEARQEQRNDRFHGMADALIVLLKSRFAGVTVHLVDRIYCASEAQLEAWLEAVLEAQTLQEVMFCKGGLIARGD